MLILLGGLQGSGKRQLARAFSDATGFFWHDTARNGSVVPSRFERSSTVIHTDPVIITDALRVQRLEKIVRDFPLLSKMYDGVIVEHLLHRRLPREHLITAARRHFSNVVTIWLDSDEGAIQERIAESVGSNSGPLFERALRQREHTVQEFEPFDEPIDVIRYQPEIEDPISCVIACIKRATGQIIKRSH